MELPHPPKLLPNVTATLIETSKSFEHTQNNDLDDDPEYAEIMRLMEQDIVA